MSFYDQIVVVSQRYFFKLFALSHEGDFVMTKVKYFCSIGKTLGWKFLKQ